MTASNTPRSAILAACADMIRACGLTVQEIVDELARPPRQAQPLRMLPVAGEVDIDAVHAAAAPASPPRSTGPALSSQAQQVLEFAAKPKGAIVKEFAILLDVDYSTAAYHCGRLVGARLLTKVKVRGEHAFRYWSNPAHALAYVEAKAQQAEPAAPEPAVSPAAAPAPFPEPAPAAAPAAATLTVDEVRSVEIHAAKVAASKKAPPPMGARTKKPLAHQALTITPPKVPPEATRPRGEAIKTEKTVETCDTTVRPTAKWQRLELPPDPRYPSFSSMPPGVDPRTGKAWGATA